MKKIFLIVILLLAANFADAGPVSYYGRLQVREGRAFIDGVKEGRDNIRLVQIRGTSFGWSNTGWESARFYNANAVERVVKDWKAEVVRAAYGATRDAFSSANAIANRERVETVIDAAIANDVYIIIDWHSHNAHSETETQNAIDFFSYMAEKYGKYDHVIFELYNEPTNANNGTWPNIKAYAEKVIPFIRAHSSNLILVGTPEWCQRVETVIGNAIDDPNIGYVLHFYAYSHSLPAFFSNVDAVISSGLPIFVTEYGTTHSDGGQLNANNYDSHSAVRTDEWHNYMDSKKISSVAWNINDKYEGSAFFGSVQGSIFDQTIAANWSDPAKMTESGKYIFNKLNNYYLTAPWNPDVVSIKSQSIKLPLLQGSSYELYTLQGKLVRHAPGNGVYILRIRQNGTTQTKIVNFIK